VLFGEGRRAFVKQLVANGDEDEIAAAAGLVLDGADRRALLHLRTEQQGSEERDPAAGPHAVGQWHRGQEAATGRMTITAELGWRQALEEVEPVPQRRQGRAFDELLLRQAEGGGHQAGMTDA
jgi:hypothetical protein